MRKGVVVGFLFLILFTTFVSASFLSDFFNKKSPGLSPEDACSDPDGENIYLKSSITGLDAYGNAQTYDDRCSVSSEISVLEYYCDFTVPSPNIKMQSITCPTGYLCNVGACILLTGSPETNSTCSSSERSCTDKIDNDCDSIIDCNDKDCTGNSACLEDRSCNDLDGTGSEVEDGEASLSIPGRAKNSATKYDSCLSENKISEAYCRSGSALTAGAECPSSKPFCITKDASEWKDLGFNTPWGSFDVSACVQCTQDLQCSSGSCIDFKCTLETETNETQFNQTITCEDSDGDNIYTKGEVTIKEDVSQVAYPDKCGSNEIVLENLCFDDNRVIKEFSCPSGYSCNKGACIIESNESELENSCQPLIDGLKDVIEGNTNGNFEFEGITFDLSYNSKHEYSYWIDGNDEEVTEYTASWHGYAYNENYYYRQSVIVFDNFQVSLDSWLGQRLSWNVCKTVDFYNNYETSEGRETVYVCNWRAMWPSGNIEESKELEIIWVKDNVIVEAYTNTGRYLSEDELQLLYSRKFNDFLNALQNNPREYIGWEYLGLQWPFKNLVGELLELCPSDIPQPTDDDGNECYPSWSCKTEPLICPEYGYQTRTCVDYSCGKEITQRIDCNPALCSGCYVPKWLGSDFYATKCIPYGFRFAQEVEGPLKLVERSESETINQITTNDYKLEVISDTEAKLTFYDKDGTENNYDLVKGQYTKIELPFWDEEIEHVDLYVNNVIFIKEGSSDNYIDITFTVLGFERSIKKFNAYCDIDGEVKVQKKKDKYTGEWAPCQNNYECDSNLCSSGQCIEVNEAIKEAGKFKGMFFRVFCRIANTFNEQDYDSCVAEFLGLEPSANDKFAQCLTDSGATLYCAYWSPHCADQRELFGSSFGYVRNVECDPRGDDSNSDLCLEKKVESYPTWEFSDGTFASGTQAFSDLAIRTGCLMP